jgi:hypothetical protein
VRLADGAHCHNRLITPSAKDKVNKSEYNIMHCCEVEVRVGHNHPYTGTLEVGLQSSNKEPVTGWYPLVRVGQLRDLTTVSYNVCGEYCGPQE